MTTVTQDKLVSFLRARGANRQPITVGRKDFAEGGMPNWWLRGYHQYLREMEANGLIRTSAREDGTYAVQLLSTTTTPTIRRTDRRSSSVQVGSFDPGMTTVEVPLTVRIGLDIVGRGGLPEPEVRIGRTRRQRGRR